MKSYKYQKILNFKQIFNPQKGGGMNFNSQRVFDGGIWRVREVAKYLGVTTGHIYNLTHQNMIPYRKKGKLLYFIPSEIFGWIDRGNI